VRAAVSITPHRLNRKPARKGTSRSRAELDLGAVRAVDRGLRWLVVGEVDTPAFGTGWSGRTALDADELMQARGGGD
jgi:hypothetical protein